MPVRFGTRTRPSGFAKGRPAGEGIPPAGSGEPPSPGPPEFDQIPEENVLFDGDDGHSHKGGDDGHTIDHADLTNVTANQHHNQSHVLATDTALGPDHTITGGVVGYVLRCLSATTAKFMQLVFGDLGGTLGTGQHGTLSDGDHSGDLTGNARVGVRKNSAGSTFKRRRFNLIEGSNITLTVADDSGDEEVDVTIATTGASSGRWPLGVWTKQDISLLGTTDELIFTAWTKGANDQLADVMGADGAITALGFICDGDIGGVGQSLVVTVYVNGAASAATVTLTGTAGTDTKPTPWTGSVAFASNDELTVYAKRTGAALNVRLLKVFVWGYVNG